VDAPRDRASVAAVMWMNKLVLLGLIEIQRAASALHCKMLLATRKARGA